MRTYVPLIKRVLNLCGECDYYALRSSMVLIFAWFGYDKWHVSEIRALSPLIERGPLVFWTLRLLGLRGTAIYLGAFEWLTCVLLMAGFWNKRAGIVGACMSCAAFVSTLTILPFAPNAWDAGAGGFPAMAMNAAFLLKDSVLLAVSFYLLKRDVTHEMARFQS